MKVVVKLGDQYLSRGGAVFQRVSTPDHKSYRFIKKVREMINNLITRLKEDTFSEDEHKGLCGTELTTNARPQFKTSMENLAMEVAKLFAQVSHQVDNDLFVKVKKLIQDLIWKLQRKFLRKASVIPSCLSTTCPGVTTQQIAQRQVYKRKYQMRTTSTMRRRRQTKSLSRMCRTLNQA